MSEEETVQDQAQQVSETAQEEPTTISVEEHNKVLAELENQRKMSQGQDKKNTELQREMAELRETIAEKDKGKKSYEDRLIEMENMLKQRDIEMALNEKKANANKVIAEHKLNPEFDFDTIYNSESVEEMAEKAKKRAEYYEQIKAEAFKEKSNMTIPARGSAVDTNNLSELTPMQLNDIVKSDPTKKDLILSEIRRRNNLNK